MLKIINLHANLATENKPILKGVNLELNPGEIHVLQGANGSGKSTLASVISGHPGFTITEGSIELVHETYPRHLAAKLPKPQKEAITITDLTPDLRSLAGIFLANQYPLSIPGVNLVNFLRLAHNARQEKDIPVFKFRKLLEQRAQLISYPSHLLERNLNEGFSGGEKKKTEILQLAVLEPRYAILDETDSGLDKQALGEVFEGLMQIKKILPNITFLIITHYEKVFDYTKPDFVHEMKAGVITKSQAL